MALALACVRKAPARASAVAPPGLSLDRARLHLLHRAAPGRLGRRHGAGGPGLPVRTLPGHALLLVSAPTSGPPPTAAPQPAGSPSPRVSRYWLWYTTKACVGAWRRRPGERLRLHRVNLIALQGPPGPQAGPAAVPAPQQGGGGGPGDGAGRRASASPLSGSSPRRWAATLRRLLERTAALSLGHRGDV